MRNYLLISEIEDVLEYCTGFNESQYETLMSKVEEVANTCLCAAHSYSECSCGAWEAGEGDWEDL